VNTGPVGHASSKERFVIYAHNATYDKLHQVATLGLTAAAMGKDVIVVLLFWTIKKLADGRLDELDFPPEYAAQAPEVARLIRERNVPLISDMFKEAKQVGKFKLVACSAGLEYMGVDVQAVNDGVDEVMGLPAILAACTGAETTLFI
jgi:peroxiredoxin family protein